MEGVSGREKIEIDDCMNDQSRAKPFPRKRKKPCASIAGFFTFFSQYHHSRYTFDSWIFVCRMKTVFFTFLLNLRIYL